MSGMACVYVALRAIQQPGVYVLLLSGTTGNVDPVASARTSDGETWVETGRLPLGGAVQGYDVFRYSPTLGSGSGRLLATWTASGGIAISDNLGSTWSDGGGFAGLNWESVEWCSGFNSGSGYFVLGSSNASTAFSATGLSGSWTEGSLPDGGYRLIYLSYAATLGASGRLVGVGWIGTTSVGCIAYSDNGTSFTSAVSDYDAQFRGVRWIEQESAYFAAAANGDILRSTDGESWSVVDTLSGTLGRCDFAYDDTSELLFLTSVSGTAAGTYTSDDSGATWTLVDSSGGTAIAIAFGFIFVARFHETLRVSDDSGATWSNVTPLDTGQDAWIDVMTLTVS